MNEEVKNRSKFAKWVCNLFKDDEPLTAKECWNRRRFGGKSRTFEDQVKDKIEELERLIEYKLGMAKHEDTIMISIDKHDQDIYEVVADSFKKRGFRVAIETLEDIDEDTQFLVISWKNGGIQ